SEYIAEPCRSLGYAHDAARHGDFAHVEAIAAAADARADHIDPGFRPAKPAVAGYLNEFERGLQHVQGCARKHGQPLAARVLRCRACLIQCRLRIHGTRSYRANGDMLSVADEGLGTERRTSWDARLIQP